MASIFDLHVVASFLRFLAAHAASFVFVCLLSDIPRVVVQRVHLRGATLAERWRCLFVSMNNELPRAGPKTRGSGSESSGLSKTGLARQGGVRRGGAVFAFVYGGWLQWGSTGAGYGGGGVTTPTHNGREGGNKAQRVADMSIGASRKRAFEEAPLEREAHWGIGLEPNQANKDKNKTEEGRRRSVGPGWLGAQPRGAPLARMPANAGEQRAHV